SIGQLLAPGGKRGAQQSGCHQGQKGTFRHSSSVKRIQGIRKAVIGGRGGSRRARQRGGSHAWADTARYSGCQAAVEPETSPNERRCAARMGSMGTFTAGLGLMVAERGLSRV